jgi:hypothetical protein
MNSHESCLLVVERVLNPGQVTATGLIARKVLVNVMLPMKVLIPSGTHDQSKLAIKAAPSTRPDHPRSPR